jgi:uncharacterized membrane protein (UPF0136 family)
MSTPVSHKIAGGLAAVYGLAALAGGIIGYIVTANEGKPSYASLIAGGTSGVLLLFFAILVFRGRSWALFGSAIVALALLGFFGPKTMGPSPDPDKPVVDPAKAASAQTRAVLMTAGGVLVLLASGIALSRRATGC